jgi:hypothetical protein
MKRVRVPSQALRAFTSLFTFISNLSGLFAKAKPSATPTPSKASTLYTSSAITALDQLTALDICKTKDVTTRSSGNNGFPRPA